MQLIMHVRVWLWRSICRRLQAGANPHWLLWVLARLDRWDLRRTSTDTSRAPRPPTKADRAARLVLLVSLGWTGTSQAGTYYVSNSGSDSAPCTQAQPCQTLNKGVSQLQSGDTLYLRGGTYTPGALGQHGTGTIASGTSWASATTIAAAPGETVWLAGHNAGIALTSGESYIIFDRLNIDKRGYGSQSAFFTDGPVHHVRFQNAEVIDTATAVGAVGADGMFVHGGRGSSQMEFLGNTFRGASSYAFYWGGSHTLIDGNAIEGSGSYGIHLYSSGANDVSHNVIRNNRLSGNGFRDSRGYNGCGIILSTGSDNHACGNILTNNGCGIQVDFRCTNCVVVGNTIRNHRGAGIQIGATAVQTTVASNTLSENRPDLEDYSSSTSAAGAGVCGAVAGAPPSPGPVPSPAPTPVAVPPPLPVPRNLRMFSVAP